jgi:hypothetical protein
LSTRLTARGYEVVSIQHDLPTDPPMVAEVGEPYVGRLAHQPGVAKINFTVEEMTKV